ncbi:unnamed protein product [Prunus brigantina]
MKTSTNSGRALTKQNRCHSAVPAYQNPRCAMERDQAALREGLESEESHARQSSHGSSRSRRSRSGSRRLNQIQEAVFQQEATTQRSQDTLNNMTAMMQWQVNRQFRKDHKAAMARIPNPALVVQQLDLPFGPPLGLAWPYQENPLIAQIAGIPGQGEIQAGQRGRHKAPIRLEGPTAVQAPQNQPEPPPIPQPQPALLPHRPRRMDPNPLSPLARGRRGRGGINPFANNDRNILRANWRNHPDFEEEEKDREEVLPRPYRVEQRIEHN